MRRKCDGPSSSIINEDFEENIQPKVEIDEEGYPG